MNITCIPKTNYFDTPEFLSTALHINTIVSTPVYIFGLFIVLTKTPEHMKSVKWYLVNLHTWIAVFDYFCGLFTMPFFLIPAFAGFPLGFLRHFGVSTLDQLVLGFITCGSMVASIVIVFENRFYRVCSVRIKRYWKKIRIKWICFHYIFVIAGLLPFYLLVPEQSSALQRVFRTIPCLPRNIYESPVFVLTENYLYYVSVIFVYLVICGIELFIVIGYVGYETMQQKKTRTVSEKTFQMQKTFFIALLVQVSIPLTLAAAPVISWFVLIVGFWYHQWITNLGVVMWNTHGFFATIAMLVAHRPYREAIVTMIKKRRAVSVENSRRAMYNNAVSDVLN